MNMLFQDFIEMYNPQNADEYRNALKEIVQEIALYGLSRTDFFKVAAFYGGTALRLFHGLDRFSEDMDFSLEVPEPDFALDKYCSAIRDTLLSFGLDMEVSRKEKKIDTAIQSAFIKGDTLVQLITIYNKDSNFKAIHSDEKVKIKVEIDVNPPQGATFEYQYGLRPVPYMVRLYDKPSLFAGKLHAVICRNWKNRVKGRDLYDFVWYIKQGTSINLPHLQSRLEQTGAWKANEELTITSLQELLCQRFATINYEAAKNDVRAFIKHDESLHIWSEDFFKAMVSRLK